GVAHATDHPVTVDLEIDREAVAAQLVLHRETVAGEVELHSRAGEAATAQRDRHRLRSIGSFEDKAAIPVRAALVELRSGVLVARDVDDAVADPLPRPLSGDVQAVRAHRWSIHQWRSRHRPLWRSRRAACRDERDGNHHKSDSSHAALLGLITTIATNTPEIGQPFARFRGETRSFDVPKRDKLSGEVTSRHRPNRLGLRAQPNAVNSIGSCSSPSISPGPGRLTCPAGIAHKRPDFTAVNRSQQFRGPRAVAVALPGQAAIAMTSGSKTVAASGHGHEIVDGEARGHSSVVRSASEPRMRSGTTGASDGSPCRGRSSQAALTPTCLAPRTSQTR